MGMTEQEISLFKQQLLDERTEILKELLDEEDILNENMNYVGDSGELAFENLDKDLVSKISNRQKETLNMIERALSKIKEGVYGICEKCGAQIELERLEAIPYTIYCNKCKV